MVLSEYMYENKGNTGFSEDGFAPKRQFGLTSPRRPRDTRTPRFQIRKHLLRSKSHFSPRRQAAKVANSCCRLKRWGFCGLAPWRETLLILAASKAWRRSRRGWAATARTARSASRLGPRARDDRRPATHGILSSACGLCYNGGAPFGILQF